MAEANESHDETTKTVRHQYENYPYPRRNPEDERERLVRSFTATLEAVNYYCYKGRRNFRKGFRALVAGGGTGDSTIFLAEQLKTTDATITHLDLSEASIEIAKARADVRGLKNITWMHESLLDLPTMGVGPFDFIECSGVLHHLSDPPAGLAALRGSLADDGCMAIMVYGQYGRTGVYQMQDLMRRINNDQDDSQQKVENTQAILGNLPATNWFNRSLNLFPGLHLAGGIELYDLLLHSQDRAYTVDELYKFFETGGLNVVQFSVLSRAKYKPELFLQDEALLIRISTMGLREQRAIGELISGAIIKHSCFVSPQTNTVADLDDYDNIPFFSRTARKGFKIILDKPTWVLNAPPLLPLSFVPTKLARAAFKLIDGNRNIGQIIKLVDKQFSNQPSRPSTDNILTQFKATFRMLCEWGDVVLLRHPDAGDELPLDA